MKSVVCPYCGERSYTSSPEIMARCAFCSRPFAEVVTADQKVLVIIDREFPDAESFASELTAKWRATGSHERAAIVDRRERDDGFDSDDRRRYNVER